MGEGMKKENILRTRSLLPRSKGEGAVGRKSEGSFMWHEEQIEPFEQVQEATSYSLAKGNYGSH